MSGRYLRDADHKRNDVEFAIALSLIFCSSMIIYYSDYRGLFSQNSACFYKQHVRTGFACDLLFND